MLKESGRNDPCPCGSGKKYKNCCLNKSEEANTKSWEDKVIEAGQLSLDNTPEGPVRAVAIIEELLAVPSLSEVQRMHGLFNLARALQHGGDFSKAITILDNITIPPDFQDRAWFEAHLHLNKGSCLLAIGQHASATRRAADALNALRDVPQVQHSGFFLECGKIFDFAGDTKRAENCWLKALAAAKNDPKQIEVYTRSLANLANLKLRSGDKTTEAEGVDMMQAAAQLKLLIGDLHGLANSYDLLGLYYWRNRQFEPAIAYLRKDLALSLQVGDRRGLAQTFTNLAGLYMQMRQIKAARQSLAQAKTIAAELKNPNLDEFIANQVRAVETHAREIAAKREKFGPEAPCVCNSGKSYQECCGRPDFEPVDLPWNFGGLSQDIQQLDRELIAIGVKPTRLDRFLAEWHQIKDRLAWFKVFPRDGWQEVQELPDIANIQLSAARQAAESAKKHAKSFEWPLSTLIMSVCALESFINQVVFFVIEASKDEDIGLGSLPPEITNDPLTFQRTTELTQKWSMLGRFLCGPSWPPVFWNEFTNLVFVRNEFVHFKLSNYEQVLPPPKKQPNVISRLPRNFKPRAEPHSWPFLILTPELAEWAVSVAERMFRALRHGYAKRRRSTSKSPDAPNGCKHTN